MHSNYLSAFNQSIYLLFIYLAFRKFEDTQLVFRSDKSKKDSQIQQDTNTNNGPQNTTEN